MAVPKPAHRLPPPPARRTSVAPAQAPSPGKVRVGGTIGERRAQAAESHVTRETAQRGILQSARDVFSSKATKVRHHADAKFVEARPERPHQSTHASAGTSNSRFAFDHVAFLDRFLSKPRKA